MTDAMVNLQLVEKTANDDLLGEMIGLPWSG